MQKCRKTRRTRRQSVQGQSRPGIRDRRTRFKPTQTYGVQTKRARPRPTTTLKEKYSPPGTQYTQCTCVCIKTFKFLALSRAKKRSNQWRNREIVIVNSRTYSFKVGSGGVTNDGNATRRPWYRGGGNVRSLVVFFVDRQTSNANFQKERAAPLSRTFRKTNEKTR